MTRISTFCVVGSALAVLALSANGASAFTLIERTTPQFSVPAPRPNVGKNVTAPNSPKQGVVVPKGGYKQQVPAVQ
jgi:hypothetical protein